MLLSRRSFSEFVRNQSQIHLRESCVADAQAFSAILRIICEVDVPEHSLSSLGSLKTMYIQF